MTPSPRLLRGALLRGALNSAGRRWHRRPMEDFSTLDKAALDAEIVRALDELVAESKFHAARIQESCSARETPPSYGEVPQRLASVERRLGDVDGRLDRIERTLTDIREQMATKTDLEEVRRTMASKADLEEVRQALATRIELEEIGDDVKRVADGYQTANARLYRVAELLKLRVVIP